MINNDNCLDYSNMLDSYIKHGDGLILTFAINDKESFEKIKKIREKIINNKKGIMIPMILVGTKKDLEIERNPDRGSYQPPPHRSFHRWTGSPSRSPTASSPPDNPDNRAPDRYWGKNSPPSFQ